MSKKHFKAIAEEIRHRLRHCETYAAEQATEDVAYGLCFKFAEFNPRFDRSKFLAACGIEP